MAQVGLDTWELRKRNRENSWRMLESGGDSASPTPRVTRHVFRRPLRHGQCCVNARAYETPVLRRAAQPRLPRRAPLIHALGYGLAGHVYEGRVSHADVCNVRAATAETRVGTAGKAKCCGCSRGFEVFFEGRLRR